MIYKFSNIIREVSMRCVCVCVLLIFAISGWGAEQEREKHGRRYYVTLCAVDRPGASRQPPVSLTVGNVVLSAGNFSERDRQAVARLRFPTLVDGLNYLSGYGWCLAQAYSVSGQGMNQTVWILYKDVEKGLELTEGLGEDSYK